MSTSTPWAAQIAQPVRASPSLPVMAVGAVAFGAALALAPQAAWSNLLLAGFAVTLAGLAGPLFVALYHLTGGRWGSRVLAAPQALPAVLPAGGLLCLLTLAGAAWLYPWADAAQVHANPILEGRQGWSNVPFTLARTAAAFGLWMWLARVLVARSREAVLHPSEASRARAARSSALFLVVLAPTFSLVCFDLLLSIDAHWPSTMFALYHVAGLLEGGTALIVVLVLYLRRHGRMSADADALHDLGKLLFAFAFFWGYLWYCQYMLIWYTNLPEETVYYAARHAGAWEPLTIANVILGWALPFALLLSRHAKRSVALLGRVAVVALLARWLDLYLAIQPSLHHGEGLAFLPLVLGLGIAAGAAGLVGCLWKRSYDAHERARPASHA